MATLNSLFGTNANQSTKKKQTLNDLFSVIVKPTEKPSYDGDAYSSFAPELNSFLGDIGTQAQGFGDGFVNKSVFEPYYDSAKKYQTDVQGYIDYFETNRDKYDANEVTALIDSLKQTDTSLGGYIDLADYWNYWDNEAQWTAYNDYESGKAKAGTIFDELIALQDQYAEFKNVPYKGEKGDAYLEWLRQDEDYQKQIAAKQEELGAWEPYYGVDSMFKELYDYGQKAANSNIIYVPSGVKLTDQDYYNLGSGIPLAGDKLYALVYDAVNGDKEAATNLHTMGITTFEDGGGYSGIYGGGVEGNQETAYLTPDEKQIFNYIYQTEGGEAAYNFYQRLKKSVLQGRRNFAEAQQMANYARNNKRGASIESVITSPLKVLSAAGQVASMATGDGLSANASYNRFSNLNNTIRQAVSENFSGVGKFAYYTAMSMADSLFRTAITGGPIGAGAALAIAGSSAFADGVINAKQRGLSDGKAFALGLIGGITEAAFEKIGLDAFFDFKTMGQSAARYFLKAALSESGEEVGTEITNIIADTVIAGDKSEFATAMQKYIDEGDSEATAFAKVLGSKIGDVALSGLAGLLSGGGMAAPMVGVNAVFNAIGTSQMASELEKYGIAKDKAKQYVKAMQNFANGKKVDDALLTEIKNNPGAVTYFTKNGINMDAVGTSPTQTANTDLASAETATNGAETDNLSSQVKDAAKAVILERSKSYGEVGADVFNSVWDIQSERLDAEQYTSAMNEAYQAGKNGETNYSYDGHYIDADVARMMYNAGVSDAQISAIDKGFVPTKAADGVDVKLINRLDKIAKGFGVKIAFTNELRGGKNNGQYRNGTILIARDAEKPYMVVAKHEITHHLKTVAPEAFNKYAEYALKTMSFGRDTEALINARIEKAKGKMSRDVAIEELAADFTEKILGDRDSLTSFIDEMNKTAEGRKAANRLFEAIANFIKKIKEVFRGDVAKVRSQAFASLNFEQSFKEVVAQLEEAEALWKELAKAAVTGETDVSGKEVVKNLDGDVVAETTKDGEAMLSVKTYEIEGREYLQNWLAKEVKKKKITSEEARDILQQMDSYYELCKDYTDKYGSFGAWSEAKVVKGVDGKPAFSVIKANGDYAMNLDFSLVCKKRRALDSVFREMINRGMMDSIELNEEQIARINEIIRENGLETACALCFVDSRRYRVYSVAQNFVNMYNDMVKLLLPEGGSATAQYFNFLERDNVNKIGGAALDSLTDAELKAGIARLKNAMKQYGERQVPYKIAKHLLANPQDRKLLMVSEFVNSDGFEAVTVKNGEVLKLYNSSKGSGGPKASLPDVQYLGDILKRYQWTPAKAYDVGGVRIQSFSDYIPRLVFDYLQMMADLSAKKLPAHAYTKESMFAKQFGMTGIKINLSLVPAVDPDGVAPGLDKSGNYVWYDGQSFGSDVKVKGSAQKGFELAVQIQNAEGYSQNCGTIAVGISDGQIEKLLSDPNIRMVIPYHKSSLNHIVAEIAKIDAYEDYTDQQNTTKDGKKITDIGVKEFNYNEALRKTGDAKTAAKQYLDWCKENKFTPKFAGFASQENYYKLLIDFASYDANGNATPQGAVTMTFPDESSEFGSMKELIEQGLEEDDALETERIAKVPQIVDQIATVMGEQKNTIEDDGVRYSEKDSSGKALTKAQQEYFKDSVVRDSKGNLKVMYHGTKADFTVFDKGKLSDGLGFFFTEDKKEASEYGKPKAFYLNITNPFNMFGDVDIEDFLGDAPKYVNGNFNSEAAAKGLIAAGYDGLYSFSKGTEWYIAFNPEQIKNVDNENPTTSDDIRYSEKGSDIDPLEVLRKQYGTIKPGESPFRVNVEIPKKTEAHKKVSQTIRTVAEAEVTPDVAMPTIEKMIADGQFSFEVLPDKEAVADAKATIQANGWEKTVGIWFSEVNKGKVSKRNTALGWVLYNNAVNAGDISLAMDILDAMVRHQRNAAQALQATRILKKLSPEGQLYQAMREARRLEEEINQRQNRNKKTRDKSRSGDRAKEIIDESTDEVIKKVKEVKVRRNGNKVVVEGNQAGEPFVFEYARVVGENIADSLKKRIADKGGTAQKTFLQQILSGMQKIASTKVEANKNNNKKTTAIELLTDFIQNEQFYLDAWKAAQDELYDMRDNEKLQGFLGNDAKSALYDNAIFTRALVEAAIATDEKASVIAKQSALGFTGMADQIANHLIAKTGAEGDSAQRIRDAAMAYVYNQLLQGKESANATVTRAINGALKDIGTTISEVVKNGNTEDVKPKIISILVGKYGFGVVEATNTAQVVEKQFGKMVEEYSRNKLESMFRKREVARKEIKEYLTELARLGAFMPGSNYNTLATQKIFKTDAQIKVNEELAKQLLTEKDEDKRAAILEDIYKDIGRQLPSTFADKWNAWRYVAMLANVRTHLRNLSGNFVFSPLIMAKNALATGIEALAFNASGGAIERTKGGIANKELVEAAKADFANVEKIIKSNGKYNDRINVNRSIEEGRVIFQSDKRGLKQVAQGVEYVRVKNSDLMDAEDLLFCKPHYAYALASWCKVNGITAEMLSNPTAEQAEKIARGRDYAVKEALKATFRDANDFSDAISKIGRYHGDSKTLEALSMVADGIMPFRRTPANIAVRAFEYSPVGFIKSITWNAVKLKQGKITAAEFIDNLAAGLTGTMITMLGVFLARLGVVVGAPADEEEEKMNDLQGYQKYSVILGDSTWTLDWLAPESIPFFMGVNLYQISQNKMGWKDIVTIIGNLGEPMLEMSCLSGIQSTLESISSVYTGGFQALPSALMNATVSYITQGIPTLSGQLERSTQSKGMMTYVESKEISNLHPDLQKIAGKISAKIPGWDYQQIPYIDAWGRTEKTENMFFNFLDNVINPAYVADIKETDMEIELQRLYDATGEASVLPDRAAKRFTVYDKDGNAHERHLTADDYPKYATLVGRNAYALMIALTESADYQALTDEEKVAAVRSVYEFSRAYSKQVFTKDDEYKYTMSSGMAKGLNACKTQNISIAKYLVMKVKISDIEGIPYASDPTKTVTNSASLRKMEYIYSVGGLTDAQRQALYEVFNVGESVRHYTKAKVSQTLNVLERQAQYK